MDTFVEQIVQKKKQPLDFLIMAATATGALLLSFIIIKYVLWLMPTIVLVLWGAWWVITGRSREFEYSITNGEMDVDCIVARRRRKRLASVTCGKVDEYGPLNPEKLVGRKFDRTLMAAPEMNMEGNFYFTYRSKKYGNTLVVFHPDERVQQAFFASLPRLKQIELEKERRNSGV